MDVEVVETSLRGSSGADTTHGPKPDVLPACIRCQKPLTIGVHIHNGCPINKDAKTQPFVPAATKVSDVSGGRSSGSQESCFSDERGDWAITTVMFFVTKCPRPYLPEL